MTTDRSPDDRTRATLLRLPPDRGERFEEEWEATRRRIEAVRDAPVTHDVEPAGAPRLDPDDA